MTMQCMHTTPHPCLHEEPGALPPNPPHFPPPAAAQTSEEACIHRATLCNPSQQTRGSHTNQRILQPLISAAASPNIPSPGQANSRSVHRARAATMAHARHIQFVSTRVQVCIVDRAGEAGGPHSHSRHQLQPRSTSRMQLMLPGQLRTSSAHHSTSQTVMTAATCTSTPNDQTQPPGVQLSWWSSDTYCPAFTSNYTAALEKWWSQASSTHTLIGALAACSLLQCKCTPAHSTNAHAFE